MNRSSQSDSSSSSAPSGSELKKYRLPKKIRSALNRLRWRIRRYIVFDGILLMLVWVVAMFWASLALDYLPILIGFDELSRPTRIVLLTQTGVLLAWTLYQVVLQKIFVKLGDESMALLLERKYEDFHDSLLTIVGHSNRKQQDASVDSQLIQETERRAEKAMEQVDVGQVLNERSLTKRMLITGLLILSVAGFALIRPATFKIAAQRLYGLSQDPWPRQNQIEIVGLKVQRENIIEGISEFGEVQSMLNDQFKIARGSSVTLMVRARADVENATEASSRTSDNSKRLPSSCIMRYRTLEGDRGIQALKKIGAPRDGYQLYTLDGQPLRGMLSKLNFDIRGGDHRVGPFEINVVDVPVIRNATLGCTFPNYMAATNSSRWQPQDIAWKGQAELPIGTKVTLRAKTNKPLNKVYVYDRDAKIMTSIPAEGESFEFKIKPLAAPMNLHFYLCDTDGVVAEQPYPISIGTIEDQPPAVTTALQGIGTAITPDAVVPIQGTVKDDIGLSKTWIEIETPVTDHLLEPVQLAKGKLESLIDFRQRKQQSPAGSAFELPAGGDNTVALVVKAEDGFDLGDEPNLGVGDRYVLDVVSPNSLLRILERLEVGQRRRLEQIYSEMSDARDYLVRSKSKTDSAQGFEPGDRNNDNRYNPKNVEEADERIRRSELRLLFSQRSILQVDKSRQELSGVAEAFENIRLQLINNRIDSEDRKQRLAEQIVAPLNLIAAESMQQLKEDTIVLENKLRELQSLPQDRSISESADVLATEAIRSADVVLNQLDEVLSILVKYETQNELLDLVRQMIKQQEEIMKRTKKERQKSAFEGLLDDE